MLNFNLNRNLDCKSLCQKIDMYINKFMQESDNKNIQDHILHIQIKPIQDGILINNNQKLLPLDFSEQES